MVIANSLMLWAKAYIKVYYDSKGTRDAYTTRSKSIFEYKNVYLGDQYIIYSTYADILQVIFTVMLYGIGIPMLFPIGLLYIMMHYIFDRIDLAYNYSRPP